MSGHTPGPWVVYTVEHPHYLGGTHKERWIISGWDHPQAKGPLTIVGPSIGLGPTEQSSAVHLAGVWSEDDAHLIAAAPDLLAVVLELEESASYWSEYDVPLGIVDRIRAAISKARGEKL